jgi:shikimate kinase
MTPTRHVVLVGLMSSGKTSVGRRVAERLGRPLVDGDEVLEARTGGRTAADVAEADGIEALHRLEEEIALAALAGPEAAVIGPAASAIDSAAFRDALAGHVVVWLSAPPAHLAERAGRKGHRPLLDGDDGDDLALFERQVREREPLVLPLADLVVDVVGLSKDEQADAIAALL